MRIPLRRVRSFDKVIHFEKDVQEGPYLKHFFDHVFTVVVEGAVRAVVQHLDELSLAHLLDLLEGWYLPHLQSLFHDVVDAGLALLVGTVPVSQAPE